jgi:hypothetical protein
MIAEPFLDHAVCQFDRDVQVLRVLELRPVEQQVGPLIDGRQMVPRKRVNVRELDQAHFNLPKTSASVSPQTPGGAFEILHRMQIACACTSASIAWSSVIDHSWLSMVLVIMCAKVTPALGSASDGLAPSASAGRCG